MRSSSLFIAKRQWCAGVTLIELLVSVGVIAVLAALLFSAGGIGRDGVNTAKCVANLKQIGAAALVYASDHNGFLPPSISNPGEAGGTMGERDWYQYLQFKDIATWDNIGVLPNPNYPANRPHAQTVYTCPSNPDRIGSWYTPNYAYNQGLGLNMQRAKLVRITTPARTIMAVDSAIRFAGFSDPQLGPANTVHYSTSYGGSFQWRSSVNFTLHRGKANFLMVDGHVQALSYEEVETRSSNLELLWTRDNEPYLDAIW